MNSKANDHGDRILVLEKLLIKFEPNTGSSKTILREKCSWCKLDDVTRNLEECITELKLLIGELQKLNVHIDESEMITHILLNLPEEYQTIVEILEEKLDDKDDPLTIERIRDKFLVKFDQVNKQSRPRTLREYEKSLYVKSQYKGT